ncbi:hypothetical protein [Oceanobacillus halophilus]|uniref:Uncharacterized protein n=1 Tax=Oceanobacillus halophilus TaxID=930130 RepID=A0A495ACL9_9BACI|nr:hypothetical protein [Oceanobacillus halophilus]RKQ37688.1 hypothetical protein D8M06_02470 [Oceanobacillus halophilus]
MNVKIEEDQANELRSLFDEITEEKHGREKEVFSEERRNEKREIDILELPPRKEVHISRGRARLKISRPFIRFILVVIVLLAIIFGAYYYWGDEVFQLMS